MELVNGTTNISDSSEQLRIRVTRRLLYGHYCVACIEKVTGPPYIGFEEALSNGLAAIVSYECAGSEYDQNGKVLSPSKLLEHLTRLEVIDEEESLLLSEAIKETQKLRHARAQDEWLQTNPRHLQALVDLDSHPALSVLDRAKTSSYEELVLALYQDEVDDALPIRPKDRYVMPDPEQCPECLRITLMGDGFDDFGVGLAAGAVCIACGYERTVEHEMEDAFRRLIDRD